MRISLYNALIYACTYLFSYIRIYTGSHIYVSMHNALRHSDCIVHIIHVYIHALMYTCAYMFSYIRIHTFSYVYVCIYFLMYTHTCMFSCILLNACSHMYNCNYCVRQQRRRTIHSSASDTLGAQVCKYYRITGLFCHVVRLFCLTPGIF